MFLNMGHLRPLCNLFIISRNNYANLQQIEVKYEPSRIRCRDSNLQPPDCQLLPKPIDQDSRPIVVHFSTLQSRFTIETSNTDRRSRGQAC